MPRRGASGPPQFALRDVVAGQAGTIGYRSDTAGWRLPEPRGFGRGLPRHSNHQLTHRMRPYRRSARGVSNRPAGRLGAPAARRVYGAHGAVLAVGSREDDEGLPPMQARQPGAAATAVRAAVRCVRIGLAGRGIYLSIGGPGARGARSGAGEFLLEAAPGVLGPGGAFNCKWNRIVT